MGALQPGHLIIILVIVLVIFGPSKIPELGKAVGDGLRELRRSTSDESPATAAHPATAATRTCPNCHAAVPQHDRFCGVCGVQVTGGAAA